MKLSSGEVVNFFSTYETLMVICLCFLLTCGCFVGGIFHAMMSLLRVNLFLEASAMRCIPGVKLECQVKCSCLFMCWQLPPRPHWQQDSLQCTTRQQNLHVALAIQYSSGYQIAPSRF